MHIVPIQTRERGNPLYPLPADYPTLTAEGQRKARVNACRQWLLPDRDIDVKAERKVESLNFFDHYYLRPDPVSGWNPFFYDQEPLPTPPMHHEVVRMCAKYRSTLCVMPRGAAKSVLNCKDMALILISGQAKSIIYATSSEANTRVVGQRVKDTCYENERIVDDFSPEYSGRMKPTRGESPTGIEHFYVTNGSWLRCISAASAQRGGRPFKYKLDDPEHDASASTSMINYRDWMETLIFQVIYPMIMRGETSLDWMATFISKRHFAYRAMEMVNTSEGMRAKDPRFNFWARLCVRAAYNVPDPTPEEPNRTKVVSCWPEMWPATIAEKNANPELTGRISLEEIRQVIGPAHFNSEYLANPGVEDETFFGDLTEEKHGWFFEGLDPAFEESPYHSNATICFWRKGALHREKLSEFLQTRRLFLTADTSYTSNTNSDYKVACVMAIDYRTNELFVLDLWSDQVPEHRLVSEIMRLADYWKVPTLHPELVRESVSLADALESVIKTRMTTEMGLEYTPSLIRDNKPGTDKKESKIAGLLLRFQHGLIKLPLWSTTPPFNRLREQIESYNPNVAGGGCAHDDEIDTVAMSRKIIRGRLRQPTVVADEPKSLLERFRSGDRVLPGGGSLVAGIGLDNLTGDDLEAALTEGEQDGTDGHSRA